MECLILMVTNDGWKSRIKTSLPADFPKDNLIEIGTTATGEFTCTSPKIPEHNGDAWIFAHGSNRRIRAITDDGEMVRSSRFAIFGTPITQGQGILFKNKQLSTFINSAGIRRLFVFACYQGAYVHSLVMNIESVHHVEGLLGPAQMMQAGEYLKSYFRDRTKKQLDVTADSEARIRMRVSYAAAIAAVTKAS